MNSSIISLQTVQSRNSKINDPGLPLPPTKKEGNFLKLDKKINYFVNNVSNKELNLLWDFTFERAENLDSLEGECSSKQQKKELQEKLPSRV